MPETPAPVLLLGCSDQDADLLRQYLSNSELELIKGHGSQQQLIDQLTQQDLAAVLIDIHSLGLEAFNSFAPSAFSRGIPVIALNCLEEQSLGIKAFQEGAEFYLVVDQISSQVLQQALRYATSHHYLAALRDITNFKKQQELAPESRYRNLIEQLPFSMVSYRPDGTPISANRAAFEVWGMPPDGVEFENFLAHYNLFEDPQHEASGLIPYFKKGFAGEFTRLPVRSYARPENDPEAKTMRDPIWIQSYVFPVLDDKGNFQEVEILHQDVTFLKQAETVILKSEQQLASVLATIPDVMLVLNTEGHFRQVFSSQPQILGQAASELIGNTIVDILPKAIAQGFQEVIERTLTTATLQSYDYMLKVNDEHHYFSANVVPFEWEDEACVLWAIRDVSEQTHADKLEQDRSKVLELIAQNEPIISILTAITAMIKHQLPDAISSVQQRHNEHLHHLLADDLPPALSQRMDGQLIDPHVGASGPAIIRGKLVVIKDTLTDPLWEPFRDLSEDLNLRACWCMPILLTNKPAAGALTLYFPYPCEPRKADTDLLIVASQLATIAMENHVLLEKLEHQAMHDALTGLPNRLMLEDQLKRALSQAERHQHHVAVMFVDLNRFKKINDTLGHHVGDLMLKETALRLQSCTRQSDTVGRIGGDEFALVITDLQEPQRVLRVAQDLTKAFESPFELEGHEIFMTTTIGISSYPQDGLDYLTLLKNADMAMYQAKLSGRHEFRFFTSTMNTRALEHLELESQLKRALERHELVLHYQTIMDAFSGQTVGLEALIRWQHPEQGFIPPGKFIPLAEESGLIIPIGTWVIQEGCRQIKVWQENNSTLTSVAVNVSGSQFAHTDFVSIVTQALMSEQVDPQSLVLEVTESVVMQDIEVVAARLEALRALGVRVMIDDFGVGYSSLAYLQHLPIDGIKIDKSFIAGMNNDHHSSRTTTALVEAVMMLGQGLDLKVVAEGVETPAQLSMLREMGCDLVQGYLFAKPQPPHTLELMFEPFETQP